VTSTASIFGRAGRIASGAAVAVATVAAGLVLVPALLGWERYAIVSGSMAPAYDRGSLVLADVVSTSELRVGDVITYRPPPGAGPDHLVTHRIVEIRGDVLRTKGDANRTADPWTFRLDKPVQARARIEIPYAGYALVALGRRDVRTVVIALPALLIALGSLAGLWRRLGEEARRREASAA
jgi:signal peptidase